MADDVVLLADDEPLSREFLAEALRMCGVQVVEAEDGLVAMELLRSLSIDYVFTDLQMPRKDGVAVLTESKLLDPDRPVVLVTAHGTMGVAIEAMRRGADDILEKPAMFEDIELALTRVRERRRLRQENRFLRAQSVGDDMLVESAAMRGIMEIVARVAPSPASVLIQGESGTGKERVAAHVHRASDRADGPFVKVNCAAIPESLMESEFFGHEAGAFTGANKRRIGCFELADGGTLFLDEVAEMPLGLQAKLLRALQEGEFARVGGGRTISVDVRVVAATNRDLAAEVAAGRFREDLYYRLNVVPIVLPPLRERPDEILPLAKRFLGDDVEIDAAAADLLVQHGWRGNVRELQNLIQRASLLCRDGVVDEQLIGPWLGVENSSSTVPGRERADAALEAGRSLRSVEQELIQVTLDACGGNRTRAAKMLGIGVRTLFNKLKALEETSAES
ncbi:MAG: sigma-54-dependent Fis family transcriptional regulator [Planctomycetes bacterium]|nr:sigma-54-dependent Fis family transcriptional regulator [Planctomycetota bacterium]